MPAPKARATMVSRTKPSTRDKRVIELTAASDFSRFIGPDRIECATAVTFHLPTGSATACKDGEFSRAAAGQASKRRC